MPQASAIAVAEAAGHEGTAEVSLLAAAGIKLSKPAAANSCTLLHRYTGAMRRPCLSWPFLSRGTGLSAPPSALTTILYKVVMVNGATPCTIYRLLYMRA